MNLSTVIIDGVIHIAQKIEYKNIGTRTKENVIRLFKPRSVVPDQILYESKQLPGTFIDEVNDNVYTLKNNKLKLLF